MASMEGGIVGRGGMGVEMTGIAGKGRDGAGMAGMRWHKIVVGRVINRLYKLQSYTPAGGLVFNTVKCNLYAWKIFLISYFLYFYPIPTFL